MYFFYCVKTKTNVFCLLSLLPKKSLEWLSHRLINLSLLRWAAELDDAIEGRKTESFILFIFEQLLQENGTRRLAEIRLYEILASIKEHLSHPRVGFLLSPPFLSCIFAIILRIICLS